MFFLPKDTKYHKGRFVFHGVKLFRLRDKKTRFCSLAMVEGPLKAALSIAANLHGRGIRVSANASLDCDCTLSSSVNKPERVSGQTSHTVLGWLLPKLYSTGSTGLSVVRKLSV